MQDDFKRRLIWHGFLLFPLGTAQTIIDVSLSTPELPVMVRAGWTGYAIYLVMLGLIWDHIHLSARFLTATFWLLIIGAYGSVTSSSIGRMSFFQRLHLQKDLLALPITAFMVLSLIPFFAASILVCVGVLRKAEKA